MGSVQLDEKEPTPNYYYGYKGDIGDLSYEELKQLHEQAKLEYEKHPKPKKIVNIKEALSLINKEKKIRPDDFQKTLSAKISGKFNGELPSYWIDLLKKTNGGYLNDDCLLISIENIKDFTTEKRKQGNELFLDYPVNRISVGQSADGDWYDLVLIDDYSLDWILKNQE